MLFIISDTHFNHANIIKYCSRPFANFDVMNAEIVKRWNEVVSKNDVVYHFGDFGFHYDSLFAIRQQLNGDIKLVIGNHDYEPAKMERLGMDVVCAGRHDHFMFSWKGRDIVVAHRPTDLPAWIPEDKRVRLCGHEHSNMPVFIRWIRDKADNAIPTCALNMSVEHWNYTPTPIDKVIEVFDTYIASLR